MSQKNIKGTVYAPDGPPKVFGKINLAYKGNIKANKNDSQNYSTIMNDISGEMDMADSHYSDLEEACEQYMDECTDELKSRIESMENSEDRDRGNEYMVTDRYYGSVYADAGEFFEENEDEIKEHLMDNYEYPEYDDLEYLVDDYVESRASDFVNTWAEDSYHLCKDTDYEGLRLAFDNTEVDSQLGESNEYVLEDMSGEINGKIIELCDNRDGEELNQYINDLENNPEDLGYDSEYSKDLAKSVGELLRYETSSYQNGPGGSYQDEDFDTIRVYVEDDMSVYTDLRDTADRYPPEKIYEHIVDNYNDERTDELMQAVRIECASTARINYEQKLRTVIEKSLEE